MVLLSMFLHESDPRRISADCSLFILSLHALALHMVKILLQIFLYEDLSTLYHIHLFGYAFPSRIQTGYTLLRNQYY